MRRLWAGVSAAWVWLSLDRLDFLMLAGLSAVWYGVSRWSDAAAWTACGAVLLAFCFIGIMRR